eukprot:TRINITY_DN8929_c0_g1_i1.p1 TRINITY_DN8929_c0_g1~~TRINITY_DN8929_c0_g1_i1.p1  ORF type:complete len:447 (-),score=82.62 TRINITY_DN8929_c0_g1_i1:148-1488(-)
MSRRKVCYFYDDTIGNYHYGLGHPMKPHRIRMAHNLIVNYGLFKKMHIFRPHVAKNDELTQFHSDDYINFLQMISPDNMNEYLKEMQRFNVGEDCPVFDGLLRFSQLSAGGSIGGAVKLNSGEADIAINWAGGLHHAKKCEASGFCYINDAVLGILELLRVHQRVLYVDIDIHHGDGVEEAFYTTNRVMCVSFHKFGDYFPGTGDIRDVGAGKGKYYSLNFPLKDGIDDENYRFIFKPVMQKVMETFQPGAIVIQCGADSLTGDRLGGFNLSLKGHGECIEFLKSYNVPLLVVGGGGYTIRNVARCWTYETGILLNENLSDDLPYNEYIEYYGPDFRLHINPTNMENLNSKKYLERCRAQLMEHLRHLEAAPGAPIMEVPPPFQMSEEEDDEDEDPDSRFSQKESDKRILKDEEFYDSDEESNSKHMDQDDQFSETPTNGVASSTN